MISGRRAYNSTHPPLMDGLWASPGRPRLQPSGPDEFQDSRSSRASASGGRSQESGIGTFQGGVERCRCRRTAAGFPRGAERGTPDPSGRARSRQEGTRSRTGRAGRTRGRARGRSPARSREARGHRRGRRGGARRSAGSGTESRTGCSLRGPQGCEKEAAARPLTPTTWRARSLATPLLWFLSGRRMKRRAPSASAPRWTPRVLKVRRALRCAYNARRRRPWGEPNRPRAAHRARRLGGQVTTTGCNYLAFRQTKVSSCRRSFFSARVTGSICKYPFSHPGRPAGRDVCGLEADESGYCPFHSGTPRADFQHLLQREVKKQGHWLEGARFSNDLANIDLTGARIPNGLFEGIALSQVIFNRALLENSNFRGSVISGGVFSNSNLQNSAFDRARLTKWQGSPLDLRNADISGASFVGTAVEGTRLNGIRLHEPTAIAALLASPSYELECGWWDEAATVLATIGKRATEDWDFHSAELAAFLAMTCRHRAAINAEPLNGGSWPRNISKDWLVPTWRTKSSGWPMFLAAVGWLVSRATWGYGLRIRSLIVTILITIFLFGLLFEMLNLVECTKGCSDFGLVNALVFSFDTFAGLTFATTPRDWIGALIAGVEGLIGAILVALFLVSLASKYLRRFD